MAQVKAFFEKHPVDALSIGTFGPVDINETSATYGQILASPKKSWQGFNFIQWSKSGFQNQSF